jgi:hypothetical protein
MINKISKFFSSKLAKELADLEIKLNPNQGTKALTQGKIVDIKSITYIFR